MKEIGKDIPGFEGEYRISTMGRLESLKTNKILKYDKYRAETDGYGQYSLYRNGKKERFRAHQLVAFAFMDPDYIEKGLVVDHLDRDTGNNNINNLRITTQSENCKNVSDEYNQIRTDRIMSVQEEGRRLSKISISRPVRIWKGTESHTFASANDADRFIGCAIGMVCRLSNGIGDKIYGWEAEWIKGPNYKKPKSRKKPSKETIDRISKANKGQKRSKETIDRISESHKGMKRSKESIAKTANKLKKPIKVYDVLNNTENIYDSIADFAMVINVTKAVACHAKQRNKLVLERYHISKEDVNNG